MTRYTCLNCDAWLSRCTCATPRPALEEKPVSPSVVSLPAWTREAVATLLKQEADAQQEKGRALVRQHLQKQRRP